MENKVLTKLTKGLLHIETTLPVPLKTHCIYDDSTLTHDVQYKICRYVGSSCRVIGLASNIDGAVSRLAEFRKYYGDENVFLLEVNIVVCKLPE